MKKLSIILAIALLAVLAGALPVAAEGSVVLGADAATAANAAGSSEAGPLGTGSWAAVQTGKMELYIDPTVAPFDGLGTFTVDEILSISYQTKKPGAQGDVDFYLAIYTAPDGTDDSGTWYGYRLNAEPYFSQALNAPAGQWNMWTTDDGANQLTFFDTAKTAGGFGFYDQPTLQELQAGEINWSRYNSSYTDQDIDYGVEKVKYISIQTGSGWYNTFFGNIDAITINLTGGRSLTLDLEEYYPEVWVDDNADTSWYALPGHYQTIVKGLANVADGGTVQVAAGTYNESVTINKALTLKGANAGISAGRCLGTRAEESILSGYLKVDANDVTIDGMAFANGAQAPGGEKAAIHIVGGKQGITVRNCVFTRTGGYDAYRGIINEYGGGSNFTVEDNSFSGWATGVYLQNVETAGVVGNLMENNYVGMSADFPVGLNVQGNAFEDNEEGFGLSMNTSSTATAHYNAFVDNGSAIMAYNGWPNPSTPENSNAVDAKYNWWGSAAGPAVSGTNKVSGNVQTSPWLLSEPGCPTFPEGPALVVNAIPASVEDGQTFEASVYVVPGSYEVFGFEFALDVPDGLTLTTVEPGAFLAGLEQLGETDGSGSYEWLVRDTLTDTLHVHVSLLDNETDSMRGIMDAPAEVAKLTFTAEANDACSAQADLTPTAVILSQKQDGQEISPVTVTGDSVTVYKLATAQGTVQLQGRDAHTGVGVTLTGAAGQPFSYATSTDGTGTWSEGVACGTYNVYVDMMAYLDAKRDNASVQTTYNAGSVKLLGGNADETPDGETLYSGSENEIELADVVAIARVIGTDLPAPLTEWYQHPFYPDINADTHINILDLVLAGINYTEKGPKTF